MHRLSVRPQFQAVLAGKTLVRTPHFAMHVLAPPSGEAIQEQAGFDSLFSQSGVWMGAMVPKRWAKRAVTRNTIKRQIYSVSADFESTLQPIVHLVRLRSTFDRSRFVSATSDALKAAVRSELQQLFAMAGSKGTP